MQTYRPFVLSLVLAASAFFLVQPVQAQEVRSVWGSEPFTVEILNDTGRSAPKGTLEILEPEGTKTLATLKAPGDRSPVLLGKSSVTTGGAPLYKLRFTKASGLFGTFDFWLRFKNANGANGTGPGAYVCHVYVPLIGSIGVEKGSWEDAYSGQKVAIHTDPKQGPMLGILF